MPQLSPHEKLMLLHTYTYKYILKKKIFISDFIQHNVMIRFEKEKQLEKIVTVNK